MDSPTPAATRDSTEPAAVAETRATAALVLAALGIVYGDLGTSPLYTYQTIVGTVGGHPSARAAIGLLSLVVWALIVTVSIKYCVFVMRADNHGEGGIMALITLVSRLGRGRGRRTAIALAALGIFGASLFFGDSMITPAISVLSAVEGLKVVEPRLEPWVVPVTVVIIVVLFAVQRRGTAAVGRLFGPVMLVWFTSIGACGVSAIVGHPEILGALSPLFA
ncbi:MAG TPA: KUP/HAK/KT family potassium transporter, partial [Acetobacteraceae bacterium]|nr:KUP/HAK/KT family potassium transporter [Acetobacteraceae bacterium]